MKEKIEPIIAARNIWQDRYVNAKTLFLCGSVIRGEGTPFSDLDIVVIYENVDHARRESFYYKDWPIEAFVNDLNTLKYFFYEMDVKSGYPALPQMVAEGITIPEVTEFSESLKQLARDILKKGPPILSIDELDRKRYTITDMIDDIRAPRSKAELLASGAKLFAELADFYFRSKRLWSATGKTIIRRFDAVDPQLGKRYEHAFRQLFNKADTAPCIVLAEEILKDNGGLLFNGYQLNAPTSWRLD